MYAKPAAQSRNSRRKTCEHRSERERERERERELELQLQLN